MMTQEDITAAQSKSAKLTRELSDTVKETIKELITANTNQASNLDRAVMLKDMAEYLDKSALELEKIMIRIAPPSGSDVSSL
ncbi:MAG: hypothetical protein AAGL17_14555 [Cyanobacteria bacterium J06576_12]